MPHVKAGLKLTLIVLGTNIDYYTSKVLNIKATVDWILSDLCKVMDKKQLHYLDS